MITTVHSHEQGIAIRDGDYIMHAIISGTSIKRVSDIKFMRKGLPGSTHSEVTIFYAGELHQYIKMLEHLSKEL